jgi:large subunit ribosomal protein L21
MDAYAVVQTSGKQYMVTAGAVIEVDRIGADPGTKIDLQPVLAVSDGRKLTIGTPGIAGAKVAAEVVGHKRGPKLVMLKKRRRKSSKRKRGHRQDLTLLRILSLA